MMSTCGASAAATPCTESTGAEESCGGAESKGGQLFSSLFIRSYGSLLLLSRSDYPQVSNSTRLLCVRVIRIGIAAVQCSREDLAGVRFFHASNLLGRSLGNDAAAFLATFGA